MQFNRLMEDVTKSVGAAPMEPDASGCYRFKIDNHSLKCFHTGGCVYITSSILKLPSKETERLHQLKKILHLALFESGEFDTCMYLERDRNELGAYQRVSSAQLEIKAFLDVLEEFVNSIEYLKASCEETILSQVAYREVLMP